MGKAALLSVSDDRGLEEIARCLVDCGFTLLATTGTGKYLSSKGINFISIEEYTGQKEILDGRVKTLHPKIHAGILARREKVSHMAELESSETLPIDIVIVNLYPFVKRIQEDATKPLDEMIELVDIGGPTLLRAASKNFQSVMPVIDPKDYQEVIDALRTYKDVSKIPMGLKKKLAERVFTILAQDNLEVARYLSSLTDEGVLDTQSRFSRVDGRIIEREQSLRYGENPHQEACFYRVVGGAVEKPWEQLQGKALSFNNILDADAALSLISAFEGAKPTAVIMKHLNPCGVASSASLVDALKLAKRGDPRSHFGGIIAFNQKVTGAVTEEIVEDFAEIVIAPEYETEALLLLKTRKNLRVLKCLAVPPTVRELRSVMGGMLMQTRDAGVSRLNSTMVVSQRIPTEQEIEDLQFAWTVCAHVKSNAIVIAKNQMLLSVGAGQMSRIDSTEIAISKARTHGHFLVRAVAASDAFFPFPDSVEALAQAGVTAIVTPFGAMRDGETIEMANKYEMALLFAPDRHFRH
ncbi:MAG: bifunctional phosphoribosylaminoimidazolecarboxamide formyltransferase/IMP cyclohydrolase [SAR324 cluster bacterium]|uniref:Bifunctional purine biosynthesis protein PurH n=1 Tax=SAR324 cluster bacterium TaxID=2024889 RepID=A0A7X9FSY3_9DELT|nr:bifunctional phosphoribosylaminoimidazolecarboxamide formyltransferase/IMP cyclohydrolase [SAR324 cluster bacterium]